MPSNEQKLCQNLTTRKHSYKEHANCLSNPTKDFCIPKVERKRKHVLDYLINAGRRSMNSKRERKRERERERKEKKQLHVSRQASVTQRKSLFVEN
jgi:hypothetical protein